MIHPKKKVCTRAVCRVHVCTRAIILVLVCRIMYHIRTYLSSAPKIRICRYVCTRATSPPPKKKLKAQHRLRERHTHNATVIAQQGACNDYGQRYRGCTCCLMDTESVTYTHLRAHETEADLVCRLLLEKKKKKDEIEELANLRS